METDKKVKDLADRVEEVNKVEADQIIAELADRVKELEKEVVQLEEENERLEEAYYSLEKRAYRAIEEVSGRLFKTIDDLMCDCESDINRFAEQGILKARNDGGYA